MLLCAFSIAQGLRGERVPPPGGPGQKFNRISNGLVDLLRPRPI